MDAASDRFSHEMQNEPLPEQEVLVRLAQAYHERTESFDRRNCSGVSDRSGNRMPMNGREMAASQRNAAEVRHQLQQEALALGFTEKQFQQEIIWQSQRPSRRPDVSRETIHGPLAGGSGR